MLLPGLSLQALREYDPRGTKLQPLTLDKMAHSGSSRLLDSPLVRPRSTRDPPRRHRKRFVPNRGESPLQAAKMQNSDASTAQSNPMPSVPFPQDYLRDDRESPPKKAVPRLTRAYHSALSPTRWLLPWSRGNGRSHRNANQIGPQIRDNGREDLETTRRVLSRDLEIPQKVQRDGESAA